MRVCVIGAGAIGGMLTTHLAHAGVEVTVVDVVPEVLLQARGRGFVQRCTAQPSACACAEPLGEITVRPAAALSDVAEVGPVDIVFVCVKTTLQRTVVEAMRPTFRPGTLCVSFQNGIDPEEILAELAGPRHTLRVVINFSSRVLPGGVYAMNWFHPPNFVGALHEAGLPRAEEVARLLDGARLPTRAVPDIKRFAFQKTALNAAMCPICALTSQTMSEVMAFDPTRKLVQALLGEARAVGEALGFSFENTVADWERYLEAGGDHRTSMHEDLQAGRRTEIQFMNGRIDEHGRRLGVPTPHHHAMTLAVCGREDVVIRGKN